MKKLYFILSLAIFWIAGLDLANAQVLDSGYIDQLKFRHIGPVGNRLISVAGVPGNQLVYYVGAASGGIWKTVDGGLNWKPVFDKQKVHSIGALGLAYSDPEIIYAGTGESFIRSNISIGNGVYKSTDGGANWTHLGLEETGRISRIIVDPKNPDIVYVAALGHAYVPQKDRGVFKSTDGGKTWNQVLQVDENTGASDLVMDPHNPRILFAGMWQLEIKPWTRTSGGPGSGIYRSMDAGETWEKLKDNGLPKGDVGKIALSMTAAQPQRLYALIETGDGIPLNGKPTNTGELWRSDDRGKSFKLVNSNRNLSGRGAYYTRCAASPDNPNEIYFLAASYYTSIDGGMTAQGSNPPGNDPNWDHHEMWIDPTDGDRQIVVGDGGLSISHNRGQSWMRVQLPVAQLYHVTTDSEIPYNVLTNRQDGPSMKGPSRSRMAGFFGGFIPTGLWHDVGGGESGFATADPTDPDIVWSSASGYGALGGVVVRQNERTGQFRQVEVWPELTAGSPAKEVKYRFQWTFPLLISPHDHNTIYVASQYVHRTKNGGQTWEIISPDLTLNDTSKQQFSGGLTGDNIGVEYANVIYAFEESPLKAGLLWAGTNDGLVQLSQDNGQTWTNVTGRIPGMPAYGAVRNIEASSHKEGTAYITVDAHEMGDFAPYVYKTDNFGQSWTRITDSIADGNLSYCRMIKEDPTRPGLLYLGTENALYVSYDAGKQWQSLMANLPPSPMYWIDIPEHFNDLVVGTYGRGIWILDDITPIQQLDADIMKSQVHLFTPKDAYRFHSISSTMQFFPEASSGQDPPAGASLHYWLAPGMDTTLKDSVALIITNQEGDTVRTIKHKGKTGINRVWWDFMTDPGTKLMMRTSPRYASWLKLNDARIRPSTIPPLKLLVPPGDYNIHLSIDSSTNQSSKISVLKDPHSEGTAEDIRLQYTLLDKIKSDMEEITMEVNKAERIRRQLLDLVPMLPEGSDSLKEEIKHLDSLIIDIENSMVQLQHTGTGQDVIRKPGQLLEKLNYLASTVAIADFRPADQYQEVYEKLNGEWDSLKVDWNDCLQGPMDRLMAMLEDKEIGPVILK
ncbi:MAG: glycosyl hydrolase [Saprospiraceae bacterium]|nr:glycosyl hydrolase [Saprospiraceae bacterium]